MVFHFDILASLACQSENFSKKKRYKHSSTLRLNYSHTRFARMLRHVLIFHFDMLASLACQSEEKKWPQFLNFLPLERGQIWSKGRNPQKAHLGPLPNVSTEGHPPSQLGGAVSWSTAQETVKIHQNWKFPPGKGSNRVKRSKPPKGTSRTPTQPNYWRTSSQVN